MCRVRSLKVISVALCVALAAARQERCDWVRIKTIVGSLHAWVRTQEGGVGAGGGGERAEGAGGVEGGRGGGGRIILICCLP